MTANAWTRREERGSEPLMRLMLWIARAAGRAPARMLLAPIALYFWLFAPGERHASRAYLQRVLAPGRIGPLHTLRHIHTFASVLLDRLFLLDRRIDRFRITVHGENHLLQAHRSGGGAFLFGAHFGSFEAVRTLGVQLGGCRVTLAMYERNARKIGALLRAIDPQLANDIVAFGRIDSMLTLQSRLQRGDFVGFLADRTIGDDATLSLPFLGVPARFPLGAFRMAAVLRRPVLWMAGIYRGGNRYEIHVEPLADFSQVHRRDRDEAIASAVAAYAERLQHHCRSAPYNWFNFYDFWDGC